MNWVTTPYVKDFELEKKTSDCWCVLRKSDNKVMVKDVAFKEAARIDELTR